MKKTRLYQDLSAPFPVNRPTQSTDVLQDRTGSHAMFDGYPDLLTTDHIVEQTGLSKQTVRKLINDGPLPGCKIGRRLYVPKAKFIAFVNGEL